MDKTSVSLTSFKDGEEADRRFWHAKSPSERLTALQYLRQMNYGHDPATARVQRHVEIVERA